LFGLLADFVYADERSKVFSALAVLVAFVNNVIVRLFEVRPEVAATSTPMRQPAVVADLSGARRTVQASAGGVDGAQSTALTDAEAEQSRTAGNFGRVEADEKREERKI